MCDTMYGLPEGLEWPRYEDGELVKVGDELPAFSRTIYRKVASITYVSGRGGGYWVISNEGGSVRRTVVISNGARVSR